jgi:hypothetical protein
VFPRRFITVFTKNCNYSLSWARIQSTRCHLIYSSFILLSSFHVLPGLITSHVNFLRKCCMQFIFCLMRATRFATRRRCFAVLKIYMILWNVDPLLGNDREISNYTTVFTRQRSVNRNGGMAFSVCSELICYKHDKLVVAVSFITAGAQLLWAVAGRSW